MGNNVINLFDSGKKVPDALIPKIPKVKTIDTTKNNNTDIPFISDEAELKYINKKLEEINKKKQEIIDNVGIEEIANATKELIDEESELIIRRAEIQASKSSSSNIGPDISH